MLCRLGESGSDVRGLFLGRACMQTRALEIRLVRLDHIFETVPTNSGQNQRIILYFPP